MNLNPTYLHPAEMYFGEVPARVETVLGSCVAVTMWDRTRGSGCICHAVLPRSGGDRADPLRYVDSAIARMLEALEAHASRRRDIEVKLFGGASMQRPVAGRITVGGQNIEAALSALAEAGLPPVVQDTGGTVGRKLRFYTATGEVFVKRIRAEAA